MGLASARAASAACQATASSTRLPRSDCSAGSDRQGMGATAPRTTRALSTTPPDMRKATEAVAIGQSCACLNLTS